MGLVVILNSVNEKTIRIDLDKIIDKINMPNHMDYLELAIEATNEEMEERILMKLMENLARYGYETSNMFGDMYVRQTNDGFAIGFDNEYYTFVEYGTGIVGANSSHPDTSGFGWVYDTNNHGESGWWYPSAESDPNPTSYQAEDGNWWAWTKGQRSTPFMYETWRWARQAYHALYSYHLNKYMDEYEKEMNR